MTLGFVRDACLLKKEGDLFSNRLFPAASALAKD